VATVASARAHHRHGVHDGSERADRRGMVGQRMAGDGLDRRPCHHQPGRRLAQLVRPMSGSVARHSRLSRRNPRRLPPDRHPNHAVADLDRQINQVDLAVEEAAKRGRTNAALSAMEGQKKARAVLVDERKRAAGTLAALQAERASAVARGRQMETEAAPIRYVAELMGADTDSERAIRWLIALMVLTCDPLAIALTAAASARR